MSVGICVIALGVIFIWYKRKASLTSSTVGNMVKLFPSLGDKVPTMNSLLPILSELASSKNETMITPTTVPHSTSNYTDELILPPVFIPRLQVATSTPSTTVITQPIHLDPGPVYSNQKLMPIPKDVTTDHVSLEKFNRATSDLNTKGVINLKMYNHYLLKKTSKPV